MQVTKTLSPGADGTKRFLSQYGNKLVCVRHRHDTQHQRRLVTVELIVEERISPAICDPSPTTLVHVGIKYDELELRKKVKAAGAVWLPQHKQWEMPYCIARKLSLEDRINNRDIPF